MIKIKPFKKIIVVSIAMLMAVSAFSYATESVFAQSPESRNALDVPMIDIMSTPNPMVLPDGPGMVEYTYTLHNIGTVPVSNITLNDDSCSPITPVSGDVNNNTILDLDEVWTYTCSALLMKTHTNVVTAKGWANDISAGDAAQSTVVIGTKTILPIINVAISPNPSALTAGGGMVEYTYKVTNPGSIALSGVRISDDRCRPLQYIFGDTDGDSKLDNNETWTYTCSIFVTENTMNTVKVSGNANNITAKDFAFVSVTTNGSPTTISDAPTSSLDGSPATISGSPDSPFPSDSIVPAFPETGLPPEESNAPWNILVSIGVLAIFSSPYLVRRRQTA